MPPQIAVLMATHNDEKTLKDAIDSIKSSIAPIHLFIIDDCSNSPIIETVRPPHELTIIRLKENLGLTKALNIGLSEISKNNFKYIARMDADDICIPERFQQQFQFMEDNSQISIVGSWAHYIDADSKEILYDYTPPTQPEQIKKSLKSNSCIAHPTWMIRSEIIKSGTRYDENFKIAQDYELLCRLSKMGHKFSNIPEFLLLYRVSPNGISFQKRKLQLASRLKTQIKYFSPASINAWLGAAKTLSLLITPLSMIQKIKSITLKRRAQS